VQKRWQDGAADHDVGEAVGIGRAKALAVTLRTLAVVGVVCRLVDAGKRATSMMVTGSKRTLVASLNSAWW
jgi:hypothetical protein